MLDFIEIAKHAIIISQFVVGVTSIVIRFQKIWISLQTGIVGIHRFFWPASFEINDTKIIICLRKRRIQLDGLTIIPNRIVIHFFLE